MSDAPFTALSDAQLDALRELFAAATAAVPSLAIGEALRLITAADAEAARRAPRALPFADLNGSEPTQIESGELVSALAAEACCVRPEVTSTTKWAAVCELIGRALGLPTSAVYVTSVGGLSRNISVRLAQSRRGRDATVAAVIWSEDSEPLALAVAATTRACLDVPRLTLVFTLDGSHVDLAAIVTPPSLPAPTALTLAFPSATVVVAAAERS